MGSKFKAVGRLPTRFSVVLALALPLLAQASWLEGTTPLPAKAVEQAAARLAPQARASGLVPRLEANFDPGRFFYAVRRAGECRIGVSTRILPRFAGFLAVTRDLAALSTMVIAHELAHCADPRGGAPSLERELVADIAAVLAARCFHPREAEMVARRWLDLRAANAAHDPEHDTSGWAEPILAASPQCHALFGQAIELRDRLLPEPAVARTNPAQALPADALSR
jgi:hypothetical protein